MPIGVDIDTPQRHVTYAWAFLEDVYRLRTVDVDGDSRLLHAARYLGACATSLRAACESKFGTQGLQSAPDQEAMWFITAARHPAAHGIERQLRANTQSVNVHWSNSTNSGWVDAQASVTLDLDEAPELRSRSNRDLALRFLRRHDHRLYLALHSATRKVADWVGHPLDADFERLGGEDLGMVRFRIPLNSVEEFKQARWGQEGAGEFSVPLERLERKSWGIDGRWVNQS